jgi:predicted kinase
MENYNLLDLFQKFQKWNPLLIEKMKNCTHHEGENINPYHMEGDVWSHTCMVYNHFLSIVPEKITFKEFCVGIAILCHDIGKVFTREVRENGHTCFHSHSFASVQYAIDFIKYLKKEYNIKNKCIYVRIVCYVTTVISNHIDFFRCTAQNQWLYVNRNEELFYISLMLMFCDFHGRISTYEKFVVNYDDFQKAYSNHLLNIFANYPKEDYKTHAPHIIFLCGLPASGKDYYLKKINKLENSVSYDEIRIEVFKSKNSIEGLTEKQIYELAFKYCNENKVDLNSYLKKKVDEMIKEGKSLIYINNTNLKRKYRRSIINLLGKDKFIFSAKFMFRKLDDIRHSNEQRDCKEVPYDVIKRMANNIQIPTCQEGFDYITFCNSDK